MSLFPPPGPLVDPGNLDEETARLILANVDQPLGLQAALFARCWPNDSKLTSELAVVVSAGESLAEAADRQDLAWSPQWLVDAGHTVLDAAGSPLAAGEAATTSGPVRWAPRIRLARVDDQIADEAAAGALRRRLAGEVALAALWRRTAVDHGIHAGPHRDARPDTLSPNARGARFKNGLLYLLRLRLPVGWSVEPELRLDQLYGLHLRRDVGNRSSDIVVFDDRDRLVAVISSKWTWRSDRGTEAAQMVPLSRYRPDVPYVVVTAEFPRMRSVARESVEDRTYSLCPEWVAAVLALRELTAGQSSRLEFPTLAALRREATRLVDVLALDDVSTLADQLSSSGRRG